MDIEAYIADLEERIAKARLDLHYIHAVQELFRRGAIDAPPAHMGIAKVFRSGEQKALALKAMEGHGRPPRRHRHPRDRKGRHGRKGRQQGREGLPAHGDPVANGDAREGRVAGTGPVRGEAEGEWDQGVGAWNSANPIKGDLLSRPEPFNQIASSSF